ncbi:MAGE-like protein 2 isoform X2 [Harmonia axyridis]|uniref:MAGE-like protein 2 isoform X2 n=1 Tax=Harmonia axyridis TaxID=115357 RepID=UPI001E2784DD|nr:MAGE-like protein 2 isoform X2 [Harmonia axyridis]
MSRLPKPSGLPGPRTGIPRPGAPRTAPAAQSTISAATAGPSGLRPPGSGLRPPGGTGLRPPGATGLRPPGATGLRPPGATGLRPPGATGLRPPSRPSSAGTREIASKTTVTVTKGPGQKSVAVKTDQSVVPKASRTQPKPKMGAPVGPKKSQAAVPIPPPSVLRKQVALQVKGTAAKAPQGSRVTAAASKKTTVPPMEQIMTPDGPQQVLQKIITEKRVERSKQGEIVSRNIKTIETDPTTGVTTQVEEEVQKLNPDFPVPKGPVKEIVTVVSEKDITASYEATTENVIRETTKLDAGLGMDPLQVSQLVEEEKEDVENALRINPPELVNQSPERFPLKKRLQALRLSPENIALLEQSVIQPPITADEPLPEASPEVMAKVLNAMDKSMQPKLDPEATFNTLFTEGGQEEAPSALINISSVAPGPLGDVVIPIDDAPDTIQEEMLSQRMEQTSVIVQTAEEKPSDFSYSMRTPQQPKRKERKKWGAYKPLTQEDPPWLKQDMPDAIEAVGAVPRENMFAANVLETTQAGNMNEEVSKGIEYFIDCNPLQYCSRVQLRGSQPPPWFPGYVYALSDMGDSVEVARSPSQVMFAAWRSVQPEIFGDDSIVYN